MSVEIWAETVTARPLAAVRRSATVADLAGVWKPALDQVWTFLAANPGLREGGPNIFVYRHPTTQGAPMDIDFGVEVVSAFAPVGEVRPAATPAGEAVLARHVGPFDSLGTTYKAIFAWCEANGRQMAGVSWEIYGEPTDDPAQFEITIAHLLR